MGYIKTLWTNRQGTGLNRFRKSGETSTHVTLTNDPESITEQGIPVSIENLNKMEQGIFEAHEIANNKVDKINVNAVTTVAAKKIAYNAHGQITGSSDLTKADLSLGNVTNNAQVRRNEMGAANGVATLDENGTIPTAQLPNLGQGLAAVSRDGTLKGDGTPNYPLGVNLPISSVISLSEDNQEAALSARYGGTWVKSLDPAPVTRVGAVNRPTYNEVFLPGYPNAPRSITVHTVPGMLINVIFFCISASVNNGFADVSSDRRGSLHSQSFNSNGAPFYDSFSFVAAGFETVTFTVNFYCDLSWSTSVERVSWREYKYARVE